MIEKRFTINKIWGKSLNRLIGVICDNNEDMYMTDVCELLNELYEENKELKQENEELKKENQGIQNKVIKLLDFVETKQCVTRTEIKKWWNND